MSGESTALSTHNDPVVPRVTPDEARYRVALANSGVLLFEHDTALRYTWISSTQFYEVQRVIGRTDLDLFPAEDAARLVAIKQRVLHSGQRVSEHVSVSMNGACFHYLLTVDPVFDEIGNVIGLTGASRDVTTAMETEARLARALEFRDEVIGIIGHDLRNPLSAITTATELLREDPTLAVAHAQRVSMIARSANRMSALIATLLDFADSRFRSSLPISPVPTDLGELVRRVASEVEVSRVGSRIEVDTAVTVRGLWDPDRLEQVAANLLVNAVKHGAPREVVRAKVSTVADHAVLEVFNQGPPIPSERAATLFEPFKGRAVGTSVERGLGLGLYIVDRIVRAHAGQIEVASDAHGTVFRVTLPKGTSP